MSLGFRLARMAFATIASSTALLSPPAHGLSLTDELASLSDDDLQKIAEYRRAGEFDQALELLAQLDDAEALRDRVIAIRALLHYDKGEVKKSVAIITNKFPLGNYRGDDPYVLLMLGHTLTHQFLESSATESERTLKKARIYFERVTRALPDEREAAMAVAYTDALLQPNDETVAKLLAFEEQKDELPEGAFERDAANASFFVAREAVAQGPYDDRIVAHFQRAAALAPDRVIMIWGHARALAETGQYDEALQLIQKIELDFPENVAESEFLRGRIAELQGNTTKALLHTANSLGLSPNNVPALELKARCEFARNNLTELRRVLDKLKIVNPASADLPRLFVAYYQARAQETDNAGDQRNLLLNAKEECLDGLHSHIYDIELLETLETVLDQIDAVSGKPDPENAVTREWLKTRLTWARQRSKLQDD